MKMKIYSLIFSLLIFRVTGNVKTLLIQRQLSNTRVLSAEILLTVTSYSVSHCAMMCSATSTCQAFNYHKGSKPNLCEILDTQLNESDDQESIYNGDDYDYYEVNYCYNRNPCLNGGTCVKPSEVASGLNCKCTEQFDGQFCETEVISEDTPPANDDEMEPPPPPPQQELTTLSTEPTSVIPDTTSEKTTLRQTTGKTTIATTSSKAPSTSVTKPHTGNATVYNGPTCNGTTQYFVSPTGTLTSDSFPSNYVDNINCTYLVSVRGADSITFTINNSSLENIEGCLWDQLSFHIGPFIANQTLLTICDKLTTNYTFIVSGNASLVHFTTDHSINKYGFNVSYEANLPVAIQNLANAFL